MKKIKLGSKARTLEALLPIVKHSQVLPTLIFLAVKYRFSTQLSADEAVQLSKIPWFIEHDLLGWRHVIRMDKQLNKIMDAG
mgnify:CR=1 FL=1